MGNSTKKPIDRQAMLLKIFDLTGGDIEKPIPATTLMNELGLKFTDVVAAANQLKSNAYISTETTGSGPGQFFVKIRMPGVEEAEFLMMPFYKRLPLRNQVFFTLFASLTVTVLLKFGDWLMSKPTIVTPPTVNPSFTINISDLVEQEIKKRTQAP